MTLSRGVFSQIVLCVLCVAACRDTQQRKSSGSAGASNSFPAPTGLMSGTGWDSTAGQFMLVRTLRDSTEAAIILPGLTDSSLASTARFELSALDNTPVDLFDLRGIVGNSILQVVSQRVDHSGCLDWPRGRLSNPVPSEWKIALEKGRATGIRLSSMEKMQGEDSARLVSDILSAAMQLTAGGTAFHGIPFFVRKAYRLEMLSPSVIVAELVRKINEEANPREEHLLLLLERQAGEADFRVAFHARSAGVEESLETREVLAAVKVAKSGRPAVIVSFDYEDGGKIGLLERSLESGWKVVWKSAYTGC